MSESIIIEKNIDTATPTFRRGTNIVAVASGKGGVGKTWFSITLAHAMARSGRRALLFDGDLGLANVDIQLGLTPKRDLGAVVDGRVSLQGAAERFETGGAEGGLRVRARGLQQVGEHRAGVVEHDAVHPSQHQEHVSL